MGFAAAADVPWTLPPDWTNGVQEQLAWSTNVMQASATAVTQHRGLRSVPRRGFSFELAANGKNRRTADMLLAGHVGIWQLPIWPDVQWRTNTLTAGAVAIPCATAGFDFVAGGKALLHRSVNEWEIVSIDTVAGDHLGLHSATVNDWRAGDRLYPLRRARVRDGAQEHLRNDRTSRRRMTFDITEPCDWPVFVSPTLYLGHPVLDVRPSERADPTSSYAHLAQSVDYGTSHPFVHDLPGIALRVQQSHWQLHGRPRHTWFRSLLYTLDGRRAPMWVASYASDLLPAVAISGGSNALTVEWCGYTLFGLGMVNRKDLRIELNDGTVLYRRVTASVESGNTEILTLSASLSSSSIAPASIRAISFMALCTSASDQVEIDHLTDADGLATATTGWQAVVPDV